MQVYLGKLRIGCDKLGMLSTVPLDSSGRECDKSDT